MIVVVPYLKFYSAFSEYTLYYLLLNLRFSFVLDSFMQITSNSLVSINFSNSYLLYYDKQRALYPKIVKFAIKLLLLVNVCFISFCYYFYF